MLMLVCLLVYVCLFIDLCLYVSTLLLDQIKKNQNINIYFDDLLLVQHYLIKYSKNKNVNVSMFIDLYFYVSTLFDQINKELEW